MKRLGLILTIMLAIASNKLVYCSSDSIVIGINLNTPPFGFEDSRGNPTGVDIFIAQQIGIKLGIEVKYKELEGAKYRVNMLEEENCDFVVAALSITEDRQKVIHFSQPYFTTQNALAVLTLKDNNISVISDLKGKRIGVVKTSISEAYYIDTLRTHLDSSAHLVALRNQDNLIEDLNNKGVDAILGDTVLLQYEFDKSKNKYRLLTNLPGNRPDKYGIGVSPNNEIHLGKINELVTELTTSKYRNHILIDYMIKYPHDKLLYNIISIKSLIALMVILAALAPLILLLRRKKKESELVKIKSNSKLVPTGKNYFAWFIANSNYKNYKSLDNEPINDALKIKDILQEYNFKNENIAVSKDATKDILEQGLSELENPLKSDRHVLNFEDKFNENDSLLIYYAGLGNYDSEVDTGYWVPVEAKNNNQCLKDFYIKECLKRMKFKHVLLVTDSCFSGSILSQHRAVSLDGEKLSEKSIQEYSNNPSIQIITSGSKELVPNKSLFAVEFREYLRNNTGRHVLSMNLFSYIEKTLTTSEKQKPMFGYIGNKFKGSFIFQRNEVALPENHKEKVFNLFRIMTNEYKFIISYQMLKDRSLLSEESLKTSLQLLISEGKIRLYRDKYYMLVNKQKQNHETNLDY